MLGSASLKLFRREYEDALAWVRRKYDADRAPFATFASAMDRIIWRRLLGRFTLSDLRVEKADDFARQRAAASETALGAYLETVALEVANWLAWKRRKSVEAMRESELVGDIVERALVVFRDKAWSSYERPGRAAAWQVRDEIIGKHRRRRRLWAVEVPADRIHGAIPRPDDALSQREIAERWSMPLVDELRPRLTTKQRRYLDAVLVERQLGEIRGLVTRVGTRMGRNKSQAARAIERIRRVATELNAVDLFDLE